MPMKTSTVNDTDTVLRTKNLNVYYGKFLALQNIWLNISKNQVTAFIGPSGYGCVLRERSLGNRKLYSWMNLVLHLIPCPLCGLNN